MLFIILLSEANGRASTRVSRLGFEQCSQHVKICCMFLPVSKSNKRTKKCIFFHQLYQNSSRFDFLERYFQLTLCHITASDLLPFAAQIACGLNQNKAQCPQKLVSQFQRVLDCVFPIVLNNNGTPLCKVLRCIRADCRSV